MTPREKVQAFIGWLQRHESKILHTYRYSKHPVLPARRLSIRDTQVLDYAASEGPLVWGLNVMDGAIQDIIAIDLVNWDVLISSSDDEMNLVPCANGASVETDAYMIVRYQFKVLAPA